MNRFHLAEIATFSGPSLDRHIEKLKGAEQGNPSKYDGTLAYLDELSLERTSKKIHDPFHGQIGQHAPASWNYDKEY